jgi:hypothetical protein
VASGRVVAARRLGGSSTDVAVGAGALWVAQVAPAQRILRIDPRTLASRSLIALP